MLLQCGHTFCEGCITKNCVVTEDATSVTCSICETVCVVNKVDGVVKDVPSDIYLTGLLSLGSKSSLARAFQQIDGAASKKITQILRKSPTIEGELMAKMCELCHVNVATCRCEQCQKIICGLCFGKIHSSKTLNHHQAMPIDNAFLDNISSMCSVHENKTLEYYCEDHDVAVCSKCVLFGEHKNHNIKTLEEKNKEIVGDLQPAVERAALVIKALKKGEKAINEATPDRKSKTSDIIHNISKHFQHLHGVLQAREASLIETVNEHYLTGIKPCDSFKSKLAEDRKQLEMALRGAKKILTNNEETLNAKGILQNLLQANDIPCVVTKISEEADNDLTWTSESDTDVLLQHYGKITGCVSHHIALKSLSEIPALPSSDEEEDVKSDISEDVIVEEVKSLTGSTIDTLSRADSLDEQAVPSRVLSQRDKVLVRHIVTPSQFWVQKCVDLHHLGSLGGKINQFCSSKKCHQPLAASLAVGDCVLALFASDKRWYRARIMQVLHDVKNDNDEGSLLFDILYFDWGNTGKVKVSALMSMPKRFMRESDFAIECSLYDICPPNETGEWSNEAKQTLREMAGDKSLVVSLVHAINNVPHIDLGKLSRTDASDDRPVSVRDSLVFLELAAFASPASSVLQGGPSVYPAITGLLAPQLKQPGSLLEVKVTSVTSPDSFYIFEEEESYKLYKKDMERQMQAVYSGKNNNLYKIYCPQIGMVCAVQGFNKQWHRANVIDLPGERNVSVYFVDSGIVSTVPHHKVRKLQDIFMKLPCQAVCCKLVDVLPTGGRGTWQGESLKWFHKRVLGNLFSAKVVKQDDEVVHVILYDMSGYTPLNVNAMFVERGLALSTGPDSMELLMTYKKEEKKIQVHEISSSEDVQPKTASVIKPSKTSKHVYASKANERIAIQKHMPDTEVENKKSDSKDLHVQVFISQFISPALFYAQLVKVRDDLLPEFMKSIDDYCQKTEFKWVQWNVGSSCVAKYTEDGKWYRSKILKVMDKNLVEVLLLDYGYTDVLNTSELLPLTKEFMQDKAFAIRCHLANVRPAGGENWSKTASEFMNDEVQNHKCYIIKKGEDVDRSLPVDLLLEDDIPESALEPATQDFYSLVEKIKEQGLALPVKKTDAGAAQDASSPSTESEIGKDTEESCNVDFKLPVLPMKSVFPATASYVDHDGMIYVREIKRDDDTFEMLSGIITDKFSKTIPEVHPKEWRIGQPCIAYFNVDDSWARARVMDIGEGYVQVQYVDYGNSEWLEDGVLRSDIKSFVNIPQLCIPCVLHGIVPVSKNEKWAKCILDHVHALVVEKEFSVSRVGFLETAGLSIRVTLSDGRDLAQILLDDGLAKGKVEEEDLNCVPFSGNDEDMGWKIGTALTQTTLFDQMPPVLGETFPAIIVQCDLPNSVYLQHLYEDISNGIDVDEVRPNAQVYENLVKLKELCMDLNLYGQDAPTLTNPESCQAACGQYSQDQGWYRALIVEIQEDKALIVFVDYGNYEWVTFDKLKVLPEEFMSLPRMCTWYILYDLQMPISKTRRYDVMARVSHIQGSVAKVTATVTSLGPPPIVSLVDKNGEKVYYDQLELLKDNEDFDIDITKSPAKQSKMEEEENELFNIALASASVEAVTMNGNNADDLIESETSALVWADNVVDENDDVYVEENQENETHVKLSI